MTMKTFVSNLPALSRKKTAYRRLFLNTGGGMSRDQEIVLADLRKFCRANSPTTAINPVTRTVDPIASAYYEGRREVWLRIMAHLHLEDRTIFNLQETTDGN